MSGNPFDDPAVRRQFDAQREQLESLPAFRQSRAETNRNLLVESGLVSTNVLVNALPTPTLRAYIRLLRSSRSFGCDVLGSDALKHEDDQNVFALMAAHLIERSPAGYLIHKFDAEHPNADDLRDEG